MVRLLKELETFQYEKAVTDSKISNLERDLLERDRVRREEFDENNSLRSKLLEESSDKKKCLKALEDAREEIKQLKKIIEDDKESSNSSNPGKFIILLLNIFHSIINLDKISHLPLHLYTMYFIK